MKENSVRGARVEHGDCALGTPEKGHEHRLSRSTTVLLVVLALTIGPTSEAAVKSEATWSAFVADQQIGTNGFGSGDLRLYSFIPSDAGQEGSIGGRFSLRLRWQQPDGGLSAEAFVALGVGYHVDGEVEIPAESPFLRLGLRPDAWHDAEGIFFTVYPVDSQQLHLGWEYPASFAGTLYLDPAERAPAAELRFVRARWYAFAAARTDGNEKRYLGKWWMGLTGAGIEVPAGLRFEIASAVAGAHAVSGRILYQRGEPIGPSIDFGWYGTAPDYFHVYLLPERYPGGISASASLEATHVMQPAFDMNSDALALQLRARDGFWRTHVLGLIRAASFRSSADVRGFLRDGYSGGVPHAGMLARGGVDYHFAKPKLTPGLVLSAELPRFFESAVAVGSSPEPDSRLVSYSVVVKDGLGLVSQRSSTRRAIFSAKATLRWDWGEWLSVVGELGWMYDGNGAAWGLSDEKVTWNGAFLVQARM